MHQQVLASRPRKVPEQAPRKGGEASEQADSTQHRILIVDGDFVDRHVAGILFAREPNFEVHYAANGLEALRLIEAAPPSLILADVQLPGVSGLQLAERVHQRRPAIPVILTSEQVGEPIAVQALRAGAVGILPKQALRQDLLILVRRVLNLSSTESSRKRVHASLTRWEADFELENDQALHAPFVDLMQNVLLNMRHLDLPTCNQVGIALMEALANALYHGNLEISSDLRQEDEHWFYGLAAARRYQAPYADRRIHVHAWMDSTWAEFVVTDEGPGFDTRLAETPLDPNDFGRIGGRGLLLIRSFMDEVRYNAKGNELVMRKRRMATNLC